MFFRGRESFRFLVFDRKIVFWTPKESKMSILEKTTRFRFLCLFENPLFGLLRSPKSDFSTKCRELSKHRILCSASVQAQNGQGHRDVSNGVVSSGEVCEVGTPEELRSEPAEEEQLIHDLQRLDVKLAEKMQILHTLDSTLNLLGGPAAP